MILYMVYDGIHVHVCLYMCVCTWCMVVYVYIRVCVSIHAYDGVRVCKHGVHV